MELLLRIKHLLYEKRYTIEGARQMLSQEGKPCESRQGAAAAGAVCPEDPLPEIRKELAEILEILK